MLQSWSQSPNGCLSIRVRPTSSSTSTTTPRPRKKGLDAANRYAKIAPSAPHAQHMPSHIYTRVGYWKESIESNAASVKAAKAEKSVGNYLHAQDYMVYAHLQLAQDKQARAVIDEMLKETDFKATVAAADYALAASPARYAIERGDWDAASQLAVRPSGLNFAMSISHSAPSQPQLASEQCSNRAYDQLLGEPHHDRWPC